MTDQIFSKRGAAGRRGIKGVMAAVLVLATTATIAARVDAAEAWETFKSPEHGFSLQVPEQPKYTKNERSTIAGTTISHRYEIDHEQYFLIVSVTEIPSSFGWLTPNSFLFNTAREETMKAPGWKELEYSDHSRAGKDGKVLKVVAKRPDGTTWDAKTEMYRQGDNFFTFFVGSRDENGAATVKRYLDSVKFIGG